jgi:hypothetical protein
VVLPGETLRVFIIKEGKEAGQGVAYLDDGTMVVVDQAKRALGKTIEVGVTSVLQTTAGKMIFCRWLDAPASEEGGRRERGFVERREARDSRDYRGPERREGERRSDQWPIPAVPAAPTVAPAASPAPLAGAQEASRVPEEAAPSPAQVASQAATAKVD